MVANAISEGINYLAYIRTLRAEGHVVNSDELSAWREAIDQAQSAIAEMQAEIQAGRAQTSLRLTSELVRRLAEVRAQLSLIAPGEQLPTTLFYVVDVAWSEFANALAQ